MDFSLVLQYGQENWLEIALFIYGGVLYGASPTLAKKLNIIGKFLQFLQDSKQGVSPKKG